MASSNADEVVGSPLEPGTSNVEGHAVGGTEPKVPAAPPASELKPLRVLVVGDWTIDDHWATTKSRAELGAFVGSNHQISANVSGDAVREAGGAGRVATLLKNLYRSDATEIKTTVVGMGVWHTDDNCALARATFDPSSLAGDTPHQLVNLKSYADWKDQDYRDHRSGVINIGIALQNKLDYRPAGSTQDKNKEAKRLFGTSRVFRIYQWTGNDLKLVDRIDWSISPSDLQLELESGQGQSRVWLTAPSKDQDWTSELNSEMTKIQTLLQMDKIPFSFDVVAIKDMGKGVVSTALMEWLVQHPLTKNAAYFLSTRQWCPGWLDILVKYNSDIRLLFFLEDALRSCPLVPTWITSMNKVAPDAARCLMEVGEKYVANSKSKRLVVGGVVRKMQSIGLDMRKDAKGKVAASDMCWQSSQFLSDDKWNVGVGNSSVFFTTLLFGLWRDTLLADSAEQMPLRQLFDSATRTACSWSDRQSEELIPSAEPAARTEFALAYTRSSSVFPVPKDGSGCRIGRAIKGLDKTSVKEITSLTNSSLPIGLMTDAYRVNTDISDELADNEVAYGVIKRRKKDALDKHYYRIEPWRSCLEVRDYVCCQPHKRLMIGKLRGELDRFRPEKSSRALAGIIIANPGAGKTFLIRSLAQQQQMEYLHFNITTMVRREDVLASFDQIATTQARHDSRPLLVFFDEINAKIENQHAYDMFLAPLEDGYFVRNGMRFIIKPAVWLFAGTRIPGHAADGQRDGEDNKSSDFMSRMTLEEIDIMDRPDASLSPEVIRKSMVYRQLEHVYLGLSITRSCNPDAQYIRRSMLVAFSLLKHSATPRRLRKFVEDNVENNQGRCGWRVTNGLIEMFRNDSELFHPLPEMLVKGFGSDEVDMLVFIYRK